MRSTFSQQFILRKCPFTDVRPYAGKVRTPRYLFGNSGKASTTNKQTTLCGFFHCRSPVRLLAVNKIVNFVQNPRHSNILIVFMCLYMAHQRMQCRKTFLCRLADWCWLMLAIRICATHKTEWDQLNNSVNDLSLNNYFASATLLSLTMNRLCDAFAFHPNLRLAPHRPMCARPFVCADDVT